MSSHSIKHVATLPAAKVTSRIGDSIESALPKQEPVERTRSPGGGGNVPYVTDHYDTNRDGKIDAHASYEARGGEVAATPFSVTVEDGEKRKTLWDTNGDGRVNWQQYSEGGARGSYFENHMDDDKNGEPDALVQGYLGVQFTRFQKTDG